MKETYNYYEALRQDINDYLNETNERDFNTLYDEMFIADSITGNASGSYTFSTWQAEENLAHNTDVLMSALSEFGIDDSAYDLMDRGAETLDVLIRCHLLSEVLTEVLEELEESEEQA